MTSRNTMSAEFKPACGSTLDGAFEILTTNAGRSGISDSSAIGSPVSGILGMSGTVVGIATTLVVVVLVDVLVDDDVCRGGDRGARGGRRGRVVTARTGGGDQCDGGEQGGPCGSIHSSLSSAMRSSSGGCVLNHR